MIRYLKWLKVVTFAALLAPLPAAATSQRRVAAMRTSAQPNQTVGGITYFGGPVMAGRVNVYIIWYGSFPSFSSTQSIVDYFISNWGASHSYAVLHSYTGSNGRVAPELALGGETLDAGSRGTSLVDSDLSALVSTAIGNGTFPSDTNGLYMVLIGQGISLTSTDGSSLCGSYCGYHTNQSINGADIKFGVIGSGNCQGGCGVPASPNGNSYADATVNTLSHEIAEAVTDPDDDAWGTGQNEVGDKCNFDFSEQHRAPNGVSATAQVGVSYYMIQKEWTPTNGGGCYSGYSPPAALIWQQGSDGAIGAWKMRDQTAIASFLNYGDIPTGQNVLAFGDFSNGVDPQILTIDSSNVGAVTMRTLHGNGTSTSEVLFPSFDATAWKFVGTSDINGDGFGDILIANADSGEVLLAFMQGSTVLSWQDLGTFLPWVPKGTADFNGDGLGDIFWVDGVDNLYTVWTSSLAGGGVTFNGSSTQTYSTTVGILGPTDLNGDSRADVGYYPRVSDGAWFIDAIFNPGTSSFFGSTTAISGTFPTSFAGFVDANRDGASDFYAQTPGGLRIFTMGNWKTGSFGGFVVTDYSTAPTFGDSGWIVVGAGAFSEI